ncbi:MAG: YtfJ family protein [Polyangia bacterium]|nr:YtfJ family protein [Polyangia bacterium]
MTRFTAALALFLVPATAFALNPGDKATPFRLEDSKGTPYTLKSFGEPVLVVWYEGKNSKEQNRWIKDKLKELRDAGKLTDKKYRSLGIANFQETAVPNAIIAMVIRSEIKKTGALILCDRDGGMMKKWGFRNGRSNIYVFDKDRNLVWKTSGPLDKRRGMQLIKLIQRLHRQS